MSDQKNKIFFLDAMALIFRAHFAMSRNPRINSKGINTSAMMGFTNSLLEILNKEKPTHIGVAFDSPGPTFRHTQYPEYKAQRQEAPEDVKMAIPIVKDIVKAFNIPAIELPGFEADDIIGTLAKKFATEDSVVFMMTPDKDYAQLVQNNIFLYKPAYMGNGVDILGIPEVLEKFQIDDVDKVRDILGLQGDASDNIPGIPGIGAKTAVKLLEEFGTLEALVENADKLKGKQKENVINFGAQGIMSKELATIKVDAPVECSLEDLVYTTFDEEKLKAIFDDLEFRTLSKRLFGGTVAKTGTIPPINTQLSLFGDPVATPKKEESEELEEVVVPTVLNNIENTPHDYHLVDTDDLIKSLVKHLQKQKEICFDTETTSLNAREAELVGLSFSYTKGEAYYIPFPEDQKETQHRINFFREVFENESILKIGQNIKYDIMVLKNYSIEVKGKLFDTMLAHYLFEPETRHNMDAMAESYLNYQPVSITELIGKKGTAQGSMRDADLKKIVQYAGEDTDITLQLKQAFEPVIKEKGLEKLLFDVETPVLKVLAEMEYNGVRIDDGMLNALSKDMEEESKLVEKEIYKLAGVKFNVGSPKQLGEVLFDKMKLIEKPKKTKTGQYATGEEILAELAGEHEIAAKILDYRQINKLKSTYIDALPGMVSPIDGLIHTSYNQAVAATGRLSSTNPNLQNIPIRTDKGKEIRKAFVPRSKDFTLMAADYSQIELRIIAAFADDQDMIRAFSEGQDIHTLTASKIYKVNLEEVNGDMRRKAKTANFGIIYGISAFGLSQRLAIPRSEASEIIDTYFAQFPGVKAYMDKTINDAREQGFVETVLGRRRYLRDINSANATMRGFAERNAINAPIQGTAADIIKIAMINIHEWMQKENLKSKMILQVHDELVFDVHAEEKEIMQKHIPDLMKNAYKLKVPMEVEVGFGENWLEAH